MRIAEHRRKAAGGGGKGNDHQGGADSAGHVVAPMDAAGGRIEGVDPPAVAGQEHPVADHARLSVSHSGIGEGPFHFQPRRLGGEKAGIRLIPAAPRIVAPAVPVPAGGADRRVGGADIRFRSRRRGGGDPGRLAGQGDRKGPQVLRRQALGDGLHRTRGQGGVDLVGGAGGQLGFQGRATVFAAVVMAARAMGFIELGAGRGVARCGSLRVDRRRRQGAGHRQDGACRGQHHRRRCAKSAQQSSRSPHRHRTHPNSDRDQVVRAREPPKRRARQIALGRLR